MPSGARTPVRAYIGLGANLGDAIATVRATMQDIGGITGVELSDQSRLYRSAPLDAGGPDFINAVVAVSTVLPAPELLAALQLLEHKALRQRPYRNAPRTLDLDLLLFGDGTIDSLQLQVPHPRMRERAFVLLPLAEIAPERVSATDLRRVADQACTPLD